MGQVRRKRESAQVRSPVGQGDPQRPGGHEAALRPTLWSQHCGQVSERRLAEVRWGDPGRGAVMTQGLQVSLSQGERGASQEGRG